MQARISKPAKTTMQSGHYKDLWVLEFPEIMDRYVEQFIGRTSSSNMQHEVKIEFQTQEEAISFAKANNYDYEIIEPKNTKIIPKSYASNFK